jgi:Flp pilus assembly protein TadG
MRLRENNRSGAAVVESAIVLPVVFLILLALLVGAHGVFAYQEVASLAREGARYASVRGTRYAMATGNAVATPQEVYEQAIRPRMIALREDQTTYSVTWDTDPRPGNTVSVKVTTVWLSTAVFGNWTLTSTSEMTVAF